LLGRRVVDAMRAANVDPVVAIGGTAGPRLGVVTVPDMRPGQGPLAALATALRWAKNGYVMVTPCDLPLLSANHLRPLIEAAVEADQPAVAVIDGRPQPSVACWPASLGSAVVAMVKQGESRWRAALDISPWVAVALPADTVRDADTQEELAQLLQAEGECGVDDSPVDDSTISPR